MHLANWHRRAANRIQPAQWIITQRCARRRAIAAHKAILLRLDKAVRSIVGQVAIQVIAECVRPDTLILIQTVGHIIAVYVHIAGIDIGVIARRALLFRGYCTWHRKT